MFQNKKLLILSAAALVTALSGCNLGSSLHNGLRDPGNSSVAFEAPAAAAAPAGAPYPAAPMPMPSPAPAAGKPTQSVVYFDLDKSALKPESVPVVAAWAAYAASTGTALELQGNADERGSSEYNLGLGERRAKAVAAALVAKGVSGSSLSTVSYGEGKPVALGHEEASWAQNRRVDIIAP